MTVKETLYAMCVEFVEDRFTNIQSTIYEIQQSLASETKSSAGDKHETGRAMLQLEREKAGQQLAEITKTKEAIHKVDISKSTEIVTVGSVVFTSEHNYFLAISAGALDVDSTSFYAISPNTPIGKLLIGKTLGDVITFKTDHFTITKVV